MNIGEFIIRGAGNKILDNKYRNYISNIISDMTDSDIDRWEVYNMVAEELVRSGRVHDFEEMKYRVTDNEPVSAVLNDILSRESDKSPMLETLGKMVRTFFEHDTYSKYL